MVKSALQVSSKERKQLVKCRHLTEPRSSNQSILKVISAEYSLEGLMLKLKLQCFGHVMLTDDSLGKSLMLGKIRGRSRRGQQRMRWLDGMNLHKLWEMVKDKGGLACRSPWGHRVGHDWATKQQQQKCHRLDSL